MLHSDQAESSLPPLNVKACCIVDGPTIAQSLGKPANAKTFNDLLQMFYHIAVTHNMQSGFQLEDIVFDSYDGVLIKDKKRNSRLKSKKKIEKLIDSGDMLLPSDWQSFISSSENKACLIQFFATDRIKNIKEVGHEIVVAGGFPERQTVLTSI